MILASVRDSGARLLHEECAPNAVLLTPADLSTTGWSLAIADAGEGRWVCQGVNRADSAIAAVLTRLVQVDPLELVWIQPALRKFVAAEMTAFLLAWLEGLSCPVIDRPSPGCLCGLNWGWLHWANLAERLCIPVRDPGLKPDGAVIINVIGDALIVVNSTVNTIEALAISRSWARRLCLAAGQAIASFRFEWQGDALGLVDAQVRLNIEGHEERLALRRIVEESGWVP